MPKKFKYTQKNRAECREILVCKFVMLPVYSHAIQQFSEIPSNEELCFRASLTKFIASGTMF